MWRLDFHLGLLLREREKTDQDLSLEDVRSKSAADTVFGHEAGRVQNPELDLGNSVQRFRIPAKNNDLT